MAISASHFDAIVEEMKQYDEEREHVIKRSRDIQKLSKQAIFSLHRGYVPEAKKRLLDAKAAAEELLPVLQVKPTLRLGSFSNAMEEFAEACLLQTYILETRIASPDEIGLNIENEEYLGGVLDFTGELNRIAVAKATLRDKEAVQQARDIVEALQGQFLRFDLRNGALRKKYDALKYTLKKLESLLYELSLTEYSSGLMTKAVAAEDDVLAGGGGGGMNEEEEDDV